MTARDLCVYLYDYPIGHLRAVKDKARFEFNLDIAASWGKLPLLSTALLVRETPFDSLSTENWFLGLLPENGRLNELQRFYGLPDTNYLSILREVGWECAGAVSIASPNLPNSTSTKQEVLAISASNLALRLAALPSHPYDDARSLRISLGGYQEKLAVILESSQHALAGYMQIDRAGVPLDGSISTHILKPQPMYFPGMIQGEAWAMAVASQVTPTAETALLNLENAPQTLVVKRFDRKIKDGVLTRVHQEDCAQALGIAPHQKYAAVNSPRKSDPSYKKIARLLEQYSSDPNKEIKQLLRQMYVNVVVGNTDAHAKNYALMHPDESTVSLSPLYDVVPAREITPQVINMGMRIDGRIRIDKIGRSQLVNEAVSWGLSIATARSVLEEATEKLLKGIDYANELYPESAEKHEEATRTRLNQCTLNHKELS